MSLSINAARRPMAMFEYSDDGKCVIAKIMQHGDKFGVTDKVAEEWLAHIGQEALSGRYDPTWVAQFKLEYEAFMKGNELPREGTPVRTWALISREQGTRLIAVRISTVEDLAAVPDSGLGSIGLDGRVLRDLAKNFLSAGTGGAELAKRLADAEQANRTLQEQVERMAEQMAELKALLPDKTLQVGKKAA